MARRGVSQTKVAGVLGLSQSAISARLSGRTPFDVNELVAIADYLDVPITALIDDKASA
ncbi:helix-turn-helix domain-containing protein [Mycobacterium sp. NPDC051198]